MTLEYDIRLQMVIKSTIIMMLNPHISWSQPLAPAERLLFEVQ